RLAGQPRYDPPDPAVRHGAVRAHAAPLSRGGDGGRVPGRRDRTRWLVRDGGRPAPPRPDRRPRHAPVPPVEHLPRAAVRRRRDRPPPARHAVGGDPCRRARLVLLSGVAARVTELVAMPGGLVVRRAALRGRVALAVRVRQVVPPRWPLGAWRIVGDGPAISLMPSDVLGSEGLLAALVGAAGLR